MREHLTLCHRANPQQERQDDKYFLMVSDKEALVEFVKDHKELYVKTHGLFQSKVPNYCL